LINLDEELDSLPAMSALTRLIASDMGTALFTRTTPSSLSADAGAPRNTITRATQNSTTRSFIGRLLFVVHDEDRFKHRMIVRMPEMKCTVALNLIAARYCTQPMPGGYQIDCATVFPTVADSVCD
jgi:hypothetical protein